ncbi:MAG: 3'-5' exonuclease [Nitrospirae bacterium]|nr:3'-5' exonuclease [Nitrospirota bacterium]MBI5675623.1 3'-5' exonuclease [Nitrospirota bacterium]
MLHADDRFISIDLETTGLFPHRGDRVIEIGAVMVSDSGNIQEFHSLINVRKRISLKASRIHGITNDMLSDQPKAENIFPQFMDFIRDGILVAHNAIFDVSFLRYELSRLGLPFNNRYHCSLEMCKARLPELRNYRLGTVYKSLFGKLPEGAQIHRALSDAKMVAEIWREINGEGKWK